LSSDRPRRLTGSACRLLGKTLTGSRSSAGARRHTSARRDGDRTVDTRPCGASPKGKKASAKEDYAGKENACEVKASADKKGRREEAYYREEARLSEKAFTREEVVIRRRGLWTTSWEAPPGRTGLSWARRPGLPRAKHRTQSLEARNEGSYLIQLSSKNAPLKVAN
jgi:hypothetical protein